MLYIVATVALRALHNKTAVPVAGLHFVRQPSIQPEMAASKPLTAWPRPLGLPMNVMHSRMPDCFVIIVLVVIISWGWPPSCTALWQTLVGLVPCHAIWQDTSGMPQGPEHLPAYKPGGRMETFDIEELVAEGKAGYAAHSQLLGQQRPFNLFSCNPQAAFSCRLLASVEHC